jgi:hypothetical protein
MVGSHLGAAEALAAGVACPASVASSFAAVQGAWRFLGNEAVTLPALVEPLRELARERVETLQAPFALLVHDWSKLSFNHPRIKPDVVQVTHRTDIGYDLTAALLVSAHDGLPIAPMELEMLTADGVLSTRAPAPATVHHLEQVLPTMQASGSWGLARPLLHVIDREADSVNHFRQWDAAGHQFLVRADDRVVRWEEPSIKLSQIAARLRRRQAFACQGTAGYRGKKAQLWVTETEVVLDRPARKRLPGKKGKPGRQVSQPGRPLTLRFVVVQLRNGTGQVLAEWFLLSNAPLSWADAARLGWCYYWRWKIESYFKLLKGHGQQLEAWLQRSGPAVARRLLVASMACVIVWGLQADKSAAASEFKTLLVRLSGRQTKRSRPHTAPALLKGLWSLLTMLDVLQDTNLQTLRQLAHQFLPQNLLDTG